MFNLLYNRFPREIGDPKRFPVNNMEDIYKYLNKKDKDGNFVNNGRKRIFLSLYNCSPNESEIKLDKIWFDMDSPNCLENTKKLHEWCMKFHYKHLMVFSGKGFHFYLLTKNYSNLSNPKRTLYNCHKHIAKEVGLTIGEGDTFDIDWHIVGDIRRIATVPGTWNVKRKRYAICITEDELNKTYETIRNKAKTPSLSSVVYGWEEFDVKPFDCTMKEFSSPLKYDEDEFVKVDKDEVLLNLPPCIKVWLSMKRKHWKRRGWIIMWLRDKGLWRKKLNEPLPAMLEETKSLLRQYLEPEEYRHMIEEDANQPRYLYFTNTKNGFPTCENIKNFGECPLEKGKFCKERKMFEQNGGK